ncbi:MAG TPA: zf-HC2 domain-containing protein [Tepidisphaeraceae bacterium]|nr:zf-HC2 domain-containing protein [Tepidisphaeraceae bacterium]
MSCERSEQVQAYYDGELPASQRATVEAHLADCFDCRELLNELKRVSGLLLSVPLPELPQSAMNRMKGAWWASKAAQERGIRRLSAWMTAAAAAIAILVPLISTDVAPEPEEHQAAFEETLAFIPPAQSLDNPNSDLGRVVQWMADDLSPDQAQ